MSNELTPAEIGKRAAAEEALTYVKSGMKLGLGTGSTAKWLVELLGEALKEGKLKDIVCVPTSLQTKAQAKECGVPLTTLDEAGWLDLTVDGADEFDEDLSLVKGGGGALLVEKIVATASDRMIVIADASKQVDSLGAFPLPVEVIPFGWQTTKAIIEDILVEMDVDNTNGALRMNGDTPFLTDEGHYILDFHLGRIGDAEEMTLTLNQVAGVVENGLFVDVADTVIIGDPDGSVETIIFEDDDEDDL